MCSLNTCDSEATLLAHTSFNPYTKHLLCEACFESISSRYEGLVDWCREDLKGESDNVI